MRKSRFREREMQSPESGGAVAYLAIAALCAAQLAAQTGQVQKAALAGTVTNSVTGEPVPRALVSLIGVFKERYSAVTGLDGDFSISGIAPGAYHISPRRTGFSMAHNASADLQLEAGESKRIDLQMAPTGAVTGLVTDENGEPVENASVSADGPEGGESAATDQNGAFRIGGLAPGRYRIRVSWNSFSGGAPEIRTDGTTDVHYATTFYPGVPSKKQAGYVTVRAGSETSGADIPLVSVPFVRVSGRVIGMPDDAAMRNIMLDPVDPGLCCGWGTAPLRRDGSFELWSLTPGKYGLRAEWNAPDGSQVHTATVDIEVAGPNVDNIALRVVPDSDIPGQIEFENDAARQALSAEKSPLIVNLLHAGVGGEPEVDSATVDQDREFQLHKVPAARYKFTVSSQAVYVKSVRFGSAQTEGPDLDLSNGSRGSELEILLSASAGSISGTVRDDQGSPTEAEIVVTGNETVEDFYSTLVRSKADGTYSVDHLPPGDYTIIAIPKTAFSFNSIRDYDDQLDEFSIHGDEKVAKDLKLATPAP
jgi:protocatechuate 3,4-dioxygenase beta subunit